MRIITFITLLVISLSSFAQVKVDVWDTIAKGINGDNWSTHLPSIKYNKDFSQVSGWLRREFSNPIDYKDLPVKPIAGETLPTLAVFYTLDCNKKTYKAHGMLQSNSKNEIRHTSISEDPIEMTFNDNSAVSTLCTLAKMIDEELTKLQKNPPKAKGINI